MDIDKRYGGWAVDPLHKTAMDVACRVIRERKPDDMIWHVAAAAQSAMPAGSSEYDRAFAAGLVIGFLSKD